MFSIIIYCWPCRNILLFILLVDNYGIYIGAAPTISFNTYLATQFLFLVFCLQSRCVIAHPQHHVSTSSLSAGTELIHLMNVLAAGFSRLVKPSRGQDPYSCNVGEFCTAPVFLYCLSVCLHISVLCPPHPACSTQSPEPGSRLRPQGWEETWPPIFFPPCFFFFSHSNFPFQSYRPGHTNPSKSILVLLSYLYYLPYWSPLLLFLLSLQLGAHF